MRRFRQQMTDDECIRVLKEERRGVLSMHGDDGYPYGIPVNFYYDESDGKIYLHGAGEGKKIDSLKADSRVCFCVYTAGEKAKSREDWMSRVLWSSGMSMWYRTAPKL